MRARTHLPGSIALVVLSVGLTVAPARAQAQKPGQATVTLIAKTLTRLGEGALASKLLTDFGSGKVSFGAIRDYVFIANHETTAQVKAGKLGYGGVDTNTMTINQSHRDRAAATKANRPYDPQSSFLVSLASTMTHEYVHMGQTFPRQQPKWEDPAYRAQEAAIGRWIAKLSAEVDAQAGRSASARAAALRETSDLLRLIRTECGVLADAIREAETNKWITGRRHWQYANYVQLIDRQLERVAAMEPSIAEWQPGGAAKPGAAPKPTGSAKQIPAGGAWVLFDSVVWSDNPNIEQAIQQYADGPQRARGTIQAGISRHTWVNPNREGAPTTSLAVTWNAPIDMVAPGGEIIITAKAADTGSSAGAGEGDFVSFSVGLHGSNDDKNWTFLAGNYPSLYASPRKHESRTYRIPVPTTRWKKMALGIQTGNIFWGKNVNYTYVWKDGPQRKGPR